MTDAQVQTILQNNADYARWLAGKQSRISQVQSELVIETAKEPLDPSALGIRYAEIETICRQMKTESADTLTKNVTVLSDAQKAKLQALAEIVKLLPILSEAQATNLLSWTSGAISTPLLGVAGGNRISAILTPTPIFTSGCGVSYPVGIIRSGDFSGTLPGTTGSQP